MDNNNCDVFFVRHAESQFNIASHEFRQKHNLPYIWQVLCQYPQFIKGVKYNPQYIDCSITQKGKNQCIKAREKIVKNLNIDAIIVSPLERTLQTCSLVFENRDIPVFVEPILAQAFRSSCDLSSKIQGKMQRFPKYNFDSVLKHGDLWFLNNQSAQNKQKYLNLLQKFPTSSHQVKCKQILNYMTETMLFELPINVRQRSYRIKKMLESYKSRYQRIAVVAHYNTINYTICRQFDQRHEPVDPAQVKNCQVRGDNLQQLLKYK